MKILVVGTGAREHVICESLKDDVNLFSYMGNKNPGIMRITKFKQGNEGDIKKVSEFAVENKIDIAVIGPEAPLGKGIVNELEKHDINCVGPNIEAAKIETDKSFMRNLFQEYKIPGSITYKVFDSYQEINEFLDSYEKDVVIKPVGLTGGKGVKIVGDHLKDNEEAKKYAKEVIETKMGGFSQVIIEEKVIGEEFTIQAFCDGKNLAPMPAAQDHPHAFENDQGPITGGMGSYSDKKGLLPFLSQKNYDDAVKIMKKTVIAIKDKASPYKGILYGQFMLSKDGPQLIEYNARFGDPEVMNVLPLLKNPMVDVCQSIVDGNLKKVSFEDKASVCKYIVPNAYPETKSQNKIVTVNEDKINQLGANVFYAAVNQKEDGIYTTSSRSLAIVASAETIFKSEQIVEEAGTHVSGDLYHRRDIGTETIIQKRINNMKEIRGC